MSSPAAPRRAKIRPSYSCKSCRSRRVKCDQVHPSCKNCVKAQRVCEYPDNQAIFSNRELQRTPPVTSPSNPPETVNSSSQVSSERGSRGPTSAHDFSLGHLSLLGGGRTRYVGPSFWGIADKDGVELERYLEENEFHGPDHGLGGDGYRRPKTWNEGNEGWRSEHRGELQALQAELMESQAVGSLSNMLRDLPSKDTCQLLCQSFIDSIHPLVNILHLPSFYLQYDRFWDSYQSYIEHGIPDGLLAECPGFLAMLFAILFSGSVAISDSIPSTPDGSVTGSDLSRRLYRATMRTLSLVGFPRDPTICTLTAFIIWHNPLIREEESLVSTSFISTAFRVAQAMGLHRDASHFTLEPVEMEMRRRLWWHIIHMDVMASTSSGLPPLMVSDSIYDTHMISEATDTEIGEAMASFGSRKTTWACRNLGGFIQEPSGRQDVPSNASTDVDVSRLDIRQVVAVGRYLITNMLRQILRRQAEFEPWTLEEINDLKRSIEHVESQVHERIQKIAQYSSQPQCEDHDSPAIPGSPWRHRSVHAWGIFHTHDNEAFSDWAQKLLGLMIDKMYCILFQPFVKNGTEYLWGKFRNEALQHFHSFVEIYIEMCTGQPYRPFYWIYPGTYQPLQAVAVLLADLINDPKSPEAPRSRLLVDNIFSLLGRDNGVVPRSNGHLAQRQLSSTGREAWTMLSNLRRRAWKKLGHDPSTNWKRAGNGRDGIDKFCNVNADQDSFNQSYPSTGPTSSESVGWPETISTLSGLPGQSDPLPVPHGTKRQHPLEVDPSSTTPNFCYPTAGDFPDVPTVDFDWGEWDSILGRCFSVQGTPYGFP